MVRTSRISSASANNPADPGKSLPLKSTLNPKHMTGLGLIYDINLLELPKVTVTHTLTSAFCPAADQIIEDIKYATESVEGVQECMIITTFDPPFSPEMMSEEARFVLNL